MRVRDFHFIDLLTARLIHAPDYIYILSYSLGHVLLGLFQKRNSWNDQNNSSFSDLSWLQTCQNQCNTMKVLQPLWNQSSLRTDNRQFLSCISPLFQSESLCEAFHMKISFIHTNFGSFTCEFIKLISIWKASHLDSLWNRRKATRKSPIVWQLFLFRNSPKRMCPYMHLFSIDGYVIGHYANNARDFMYPAVPPYPGSGRELTLFKTSLFNPIRITVSFMFTCGWCTCSALCT